MQPGDTHGAELESVQPGFDGAAHVRVLGVDYAICNWRTATIST